MNNLAQYSNMANLPSDEPCLTPGSITAWPVKIYRTSICNIISLLLYELLYSYLLLHLTETILLLYIKHHRLWPYLFSGEYSKTSEQRTHWGKQFVHCGDVILF